MLNCSRSSVTLTYKKVTYRTSHYLIRVNLQLRTTRLFFLHLSKMPAVRWYHIYLLHPGETRMELTIGQHYHWPQNATNDQDLQPTSAVFVNLRSRSNSKEGLFQSRRNVEHIPWHTLCIDLLGPYTFGKVDKKNPENDTFLQTPMPHDDRSRNRMV